MKRYAGYVNGKALVIEDERIQRDLMAGTPEWGIDSAATRGLAEAMLTDALGDVRVAVALAGPFSTAVLVAIPPRTPWTMSASVVLAMAAMLGWKSPEQVAA